MAKITPKMAAAEGMLIGMMQYFAVE